MLESRESLFDCACCEAMVNKGSRALQGKFSTLFDMMQVVKVVLLKLRCV